MKPLSLAAIAILGLTSVAAQAEMKFAHHFIDKELPTDSYGQTSLVDVDRDGDLDFITGGADAQRNIYWMAEPICSLKNCPWVRPVANSMIRLSMTGRSMQTNGKPTSIRGMQHRRRPPGTNARSGKMNTCKFLPQFVVLNSFFLWFSVTAAAVAAAPPKPLKQGDAFSLDGRSHVLSKLETLPYVENEYSKRFQFDSYRNPKLKELRERFHLDDVVAPGKDEFERQVLLLDWVNHRLKKFGRPTSEARGALEILEANDAGHTFFCAHYAQVLVSAAASLGWVDRNLALRRPDNRGEGSTEHSSTEIWSNQHRKWVMFDPTFAMYVEKDGVPLSAFELRQEWFYRDGRDLVFVIDKQRKQHRKSDLPIFRQRFAGFGDLSLDASALNVYAFIGYVPNTHLMDGGPDWGRMFIVQDGIGDGTRWHQRSVPADPAREPYFPTGQAALSLVADATGLRVGLKTLTPNFKAYLARIDGGDWRPVEDGFIWKPRPGVNRLEVKTVNQFWVDGPVSTAEVQSEDKAAGGAASGPITGRNSAVYQTQQATTRSFRMGFTPFPHDMTPQAVQEMRAFLAENADVLAVHLEGVPWAEALADRPFHPKMMQEWKDKAAAVPSGASVYLAITPLDNGRRGLAASRGASEGEPIPAELRGKALDDPLVKRAYLQYCRRAIDYFKPDYVCIGIEVNELYHHAKASWPGYVALHRSTYAQIKAEHPKLPVFVSFTVHNMLNPGWADRGEMLKAFKQLMDANDAVAISFYPFMGGLSAQVDAALQWLTREFGPYGKPFAVAEMGQLAEKLVLPSLKLTIEGNPAMQASFHEKMLSFAHGHDTAFVISFLYRDYDALWERIKATAPEAFVAWRDCGLLDESGTRRPAYEIWHRSFATPYQPARAR